MYAETGILYHYLQNFSHDIQQLEEYCRYQKTNASMSDMIPTSMVSEYNIGGEGDLFKAPEPIIEEPIESSISMIPFGNEIMSPKGLSAADIESIQTEELLNEVFYGTKNDLMEKVNMETPISEILDIKIPVKSNNRIHNEENKFLSDLSLLKTVSSGCLSSTEWTHRPQAGSSFLDYCETDLGIVYGMRRAYSEGDIKTLDDGNTNLDQSPIDPSLVINGSSITEQRREQLSRYRNKKTKRNFGRKIKSDLIPTSMLAEYNIGGEGDLFKAPEPIIEEPIESCISMISFEDEIMSSQGLNAVDIESIQTEELLSEVFYGTENDLMEKANIETPLSEILEIKIPVKSTDGIQIEENRFLSDVALSESVGSGCLSSTDMIHGPSTGPSFIDYREMDLEIGMRRAYSEGDVKTLDDGNTNLFQSPIDPSLVIGGSCITEQRRGQLSRYRNKKTKRNFGRKIKESGCRQSTEDQGEICKDRRI